MPIQPTKPLLDRSPGGVWLEELRRDLKRDRVVESPDIAVNRGPSGTQLTLKKTYGGGSGGSSAGQFALKDWSHADFLICRELFANDDWDGTAADPDRFTEGDLDVYIAKPYWLRLNELDGATITVPTQYISGVDVLSTDKFYRFTYKSPTFRFVEQLASLGGAVQTSEYQVILPRFVLNETITAQDVGNLQVLDLNDDLITLEAPLPGRAWARAIAPFG